MTREYAEVGRQEEIRRTREAESARVAHEQEEMRRKTHFEEWLRPLMQQGFDAHFEVSFFFSICTQSSSPLGKLISP